MEQEIWKDIKEYEGIYQVSNIGRVRSLDRINIYKNGTKRFEKGKIKVLSKNKLGYVQIILNKENKRCSRRVHRLVAQAFIPNPNRYEEINHIDGNKLNNNATNLEWCNRKQNVRHAINKGLRKKYYERRRDKPMMRKLDALGRVTIPMEDRKELGWNENDEIIIERINDTFLLKKFEPIICDKCQANQAVKNIYCSNCGSKLQERS